jgi:hypothetical protein
VSQGRIAVTRSNRLSIGAIAAALSGLFSRKKERRINIPPDERRVLKMLSPRRTRRSGSPIYVFGGGDREVARRRRQLAAGQIREGMVPRNRCDARQDDEPVRNLGVFR